MSTITIPAEYAYVMAVISAIVPLNMWHVYQVISARIKYGVNYPDLYAPHDCKDKKFFDSVQRGHQNFLENLPFVLAPMLLSGLRYPRLAATFGSVWVAGRVVYMVGYSSKGPKGRSLGFNIAAAGGVFPLAALLVWTSAELVMAL